MQDKQQKRTTFNEDAELYDAMRPGYSEALYDDMLAFAGLTPDAARLLEIGSGTGKATLPLAQRGYRMLCIELGADMVQVARRNLQAYPQVEFYTGTFEDWPGEEEAFDLAFSACAFHWIDPAIAYSKTALALKPQGTLALFWHRHILGEASKDFLLTVQEIYNRLTPSMATDQPYPSLEELIEPVKVEIEQTGLFGPITTHQYFWEKVYDSTSYLRLIDTYANHRILEPDVKAHLFQSIADLINTHYNGQVTKTYMTVLYLAQKRDWMVQS